MSKAVTSVWTWGDPSAPFFPEHLYDIAKSALFQDPAQPQPDEDVTFRLIELHVVPVEKEAILEEGGNASRTNFPCRVFTHKGMLSEMQDEKCGTKECHYATSCDEALEIYAKIYSTFPEFHKTKKFLSRWIGSRVYRNQALETGLREGPSISDEVARLVEYVWRETMGELSEILSISYRKIGIGKVEKAEGILLQIRKSLDQHGEEKEGENRDQLDKLNREFYKLIPHRPRLKQIINNKRMIASKQELCQLIKDIVNVSETTDWSQRSSSQSKYRALQCFLNYLPPKHPEFEKIKTFLIETQSSKEPLEIKRIFAATRGVEEETFDGTIGNDKLLVHASTPANFLGILSRGLLLPKIVVEVFGGSRRDAGNLGSGIYFGDRVSTAQRYSSPSKQADTRFMVINKVALGNIKKLFQFDATIDKAPEGYHSTHGVSRDSIHPKESKFKDDEFVVYETNQQCIRYLVEFTLPGDCEKEIPLCETPQVAEGPEEIIFCKQVELESSAPPVDIDLSDVECAKEPVVDVDAGLVSQNDTSDSITLQAVHVRAKLLDLVAEVVVLQSYRNNSDVVMEAKYVFPIDQSAAVCGFEAFINNKHVVGVVKEKQQAHTDYRQAVEAGHGAYLMDEESPHVFSVSVGNLPPQADVLIKVTYVTELAVEGDKLAFNLLGTVAPWKRQEVLAKGTPSEGDVVDVELETIYKEQSIQVAMTMASKITSIESPTHCILVKQSGNNASVQLGKESKLDDGFQLLIWVEGIHTPRMWVESTPGSDEQAAMLVFYPELDVGTLANPEMVLVLDSSNSMKGHSLEEAKKLLLLILQNLPSCCMFNVVVFGTEFDELFPASQQKNRRNVKIARDFIRGYTMGQGGTDFWRPLHSQNLLKQERTRRNMFLVTDGHLNNEEATLRAVGRNRIFTRVFTFGVSTTANRHLLAAVARHGGGAYEFFDGAAKSTWERKIKLQVSRASQPAVTSVRVQWDQDGQDAHPTLQAPAHITSLFRKNRLIVYGLLQKCTQATLFAEINGQHIETVMSAVDYPHTSGKIIHNLAARAVIRDWEEGVLHADRLEHEAQKNELTSRIVELSIRHSLITPLTSFIAVEERDEAELKQISEGKTAEIRQSIDKLLIAEEVDSLLGLPWKEITTAKIHQLSSSKMVIKLLQTASAAADFYSFKTAEKYFAEAYEVAKEKLSYTEPLTLKAAHSFSKFCVRVKRDMGRAFDIVNNAFLDTKKSLPEVEETTVIQDISKIDELDSLQQAVEWAETCKMELERQREQPAKPSKGEAPKGPEISAWKGDVEGALDVSTRSWHDEPSQDRDGYTFEATPPDDFEYTLQQKRTEVASSDDIDPLELTSALRLSPVLHRDSYDMPAYVDLEERRLWMPEIQAEIELPIEIKEENIILPEPVFQMDKFSMWMPKTQMQFDSVATIEERIIKPEPIPRMAMKEELIVRPKPVLMKYAIAMPAMKEQRMMKPEPVYEMAMKEERKLSPEQVYVKPKMLILNPEPLLINKIMTIPAVERLIMPEPEVLVMPEPQMQLDSVANVEKRIIKPEPRIHLASAEPVIAANEKYDNRSKKIVVIKVPYDLKLSDSSREGSYEMSAKSPHFDYAAPEMSVRSSASAPPSSRIEIDDNLIMDGVTTSLPRSRRSDTERLLSMQNEDGSWSFSEGLDEILNIDHVETSRLLRDKLQSVWPSQEVTVDFETVFDLVLQLVATIMARVYIETRVLSDNDPLWVQKDVYKSLQKAKEYTNEHHTEFAKKLRFIVDWDYIGSNLLLTGKMV